MESDNLHFFSKISPDFKELLLNSILISCLDVDIFQQWSRSKAGSVLFSECFRKSDLLGHPLWSSRWESALSQVMQVGWTAWGPPMDRVLSLLTWAHTVFPTLVVWGNLAGLTQYGICTVSGHYSEAGWLLAGCTSERKRRRSGPQKQTK